MLYFVFYLYFLFLLLPTWRIKPAAADYVYLGGLPTWKIQMNGGDLLQMWLTDGSDFTEFTDATNDAYRW